MTERLSSGTYHVAPKKKLKRGEYAFYRGPINSGFTVPVGLPGSQAVPTVYDFGVD